MPERPHFLWLITRYTHWSRIPSWKKGTGLPLVARLGWDWVAGEHLVTSTFVSHGRRGTWRHPPSFHVAGVALGDIYLRFAWQAWHLWHWAGAGGALGLGLVAGDAAAFCVAGVASGNIHLRLTWQAWHLATSTFVSCDRHGFWQHLHSFCVAGVALMALGWLWWRPWVRIGRQGWL